MNRLILSVSLIVVLAVSAACPAAIQDRPEYRPSTALTINTSGGTGTISDPFGNPPRGADLGADYYQVTSAFQLNAVYQAGVADSAIDTFNDYNLPGSTENTNQWGPHGRFTNFPDFEQYVLQVNLSGNVATYKDNVLEASSPLTQWALSYREIGGGYNHTILAGTVEGSGASSFLKISPDSKYRSFGEVINPTETFNQNYINTEVLGYSIALDEQGAPVSGTLAVTYVPEPAAIGLLGIGAAALLLRRRRSGSDGSQHS